MTRETKIGLLVGLAFIIVIGILLSDHLTSSTEPPQAALAGAGTNVRQAVASPGQVGPQPAPAQVPANTAPITPVPTRDELTPGPNPQTIVKIGPAKNVEPPKVTIVPPAETPATPEVAQNDPSASVAGADAPSVTKLPANAQMTDVARQHGEELVLVDNNGRAIRGKVQRGSIAEYKAESGDSLSRMAQKLMGSNSKANRDAIVAANPSLKSDPNKVIVGKTYLIPTSAETTAAVMNAPTTPVSTSNDSSAAQTVTRETGEYWYAVKSGDSLWKIATEQCGRAGAVAAIKELNKDLLGGPEHDQVMAGTKLRLPSKPIAQAN